MSIQFDMLGDVDDTQATPATKMLIDYYGFDAIIITGTYSKTGDSSILSYGRDTLNATFTGGKCNPAQAGHCGLTKTTNRYMDASIDWDNGGTLLVPVVGKIWADTLKKSTNTGKVWIAEAGMGDFTRDVIVYMKANLGTLGVTSADIKSRIINVQHHPDFNIWKSANGVYNVTNPSSSTGTGDKNGYLPNNITVHWPSYNGYGGTIPNGNGFLNTGWFSAFETKTDADPVYAAAWNTAFTAGRNKVDFSDMIEVMWILGQDDELRADATAHGRSNELEFVYKFAGTTGPAATCSDIIQNQGETGVDCGGPCTACGGGSCGPANFQGQCTADSQCGTLYAGSNDCRSSAGGVCYCGTSVCGCVAGGATCSDGIKNQTETGVDCGGPCAACPPAATCSDGIKNQTETGVDCGGPCIACSGGSANIWLEAECGSSKVGGYTTTRTVTSGYSGTGYLESIANTTAATPTCTDSVSYVFTPAAAGAHKVWFRAYNNNTGDDNSVFYRVNGGSWVTMNPVVPVAAAWAWGKYSSDATLTSGSNTLQVCSRENGVEIDKLYITSTTTTPSGTGTAGTNCP
jgi:hypothetical protein